MSWDKWTTTPESGQAKAFIGVNGGPHHILRLNPDTVSWDYSENVFSQDTLGGRVVQLLSVSLNGMTVAGRAGNRGELQLLAKNMKEIMGFHVSTLQPVEFKVPSRNWNFMVYVQAMPQLSWEVASTSYPYQLQLLVEEDLNGVKTHEINAEVLKRLASGIGYDYSKDIHGGDAALLKKQSDIVMAAAAASSTGASSSANSAIDSSASLATSGEKRGTAWANKVFSEIHKLFPGVSNFGINSCRHISGSTTWSQHSWGNALDVGCSGSLGNQVYAWAVKNKAAINAEVICFQSMGGCNAAEHQDHVHIDFAPHFTGTPPCAGG